MDITYPLGNILETDQAIRASNIEHVFCGHFHTELTLVDNYELNVCPSPAFDVALHEVEPNISRARIPLREISVNGTEVTSHVRYLDI